MRKYAVQLFSRTMRNLQNALGVQISSIACSNGWRAAPSSEGWGLALLLIGANIRLSLGGVARRITGGALLAHRMDDVGQRRIVIRSVTRISLIYCARRCVFSRGRGRGPNFGSLVRVFLFFAVVSRAASLLHLLIPSPSCLWTWQRIMAVRRSENTAPYHESAVLVRSFSLAAMARGSSTSGSNSNRTSFGDV